jgi:ribosome biogenesis GTPase
LLLAAISSISIHRLSLEDHLTQERREDPEGDLLHLGWEPFFEERFRAYPRDGLVPARVAAEHKGSLVVLTPSPQRARITGRLRHEASSRGDLPAVGDWVVLETIAVDEGVIHAVLERKSKFVRSVAGERIEEQVLASNIDVAFLVASLDVPVNLRRLERYMTMAWEGGTSPVVVLTKADLCPEVGAAVAEVEAITAGLPIHAVDALSGEGVEVLTTHLEGNRTAALLGSSGVGKSTLVNALLGTDRQATREVRWDHKGRHTTTYRELIGLPGGGLVIDTPGMRELQLWEDAGDGLTDTFGDITALAAGCRFNDCGHRSEPGCAIREAMRRGELDVGRWESYLKLQRELQWLETKRDARARSEQKRKHRAITKAFRRSQA